MSFYFHCASSIFLRSISKKVRFVECSNDDVDDDAAAADADAEKGKCTLKIAANIILGWIPINFGMLLYVLFIPFKTELKIYHILLFFTDCKKKKRKIHPPFHQPGNVRFVDILGPRSTEGCLSDIHIFFFAFHVINKLFITNLCMEIQIRK